MSDGFARAAALGLIALVACACRPSGGDQGSGLVPPADTPAKPAEPAEAPAAAPVAAEPAGIAQPLDLTGTEPFWAVRIRRDTLTLIRPDQTDLMAVNHGPQMQGPKAVWDSQVISSGVPIRVSVEPGTCSDGMSDTVYPYVAGVELGGEVMKGCARPPPG